jgi:hypothetical protein
MLEYSSIGWLTYSRESSPMHINRNTKKIIISFLTHIPVPITRREGMHEVYSCQAKFRTESEIQWPGGRDLTWDCVGYLYIIGYSVIAFVNSWRSFLEPTIYINFKIYRQLICFYPCFALVSCSNWVLSCLMIFQPICLGRKDDIEVDREVMLETALTKSTGPVS